VVGPDSGISIGDKKALLAASRLRPHASIKKAMTIKDVKVVLSEETAVVASIVHFTFNIGEQTMTIKTCYSDTYVKRDARWQLLATHPALILENNLPTVKAPSPDRKLLDEYAGEYQVSQSIRLLVYREDDKLVIEGVGGTAHKLVPESASTFFIKGSPTKYTFVKDVSGKVTHIQMSAMGQDLKAVKVR
jgi:hypothetical protein